MPSVAIEEMKLDDFTVSAFKDQLLYLETEVLKIEYEDLYWGNGTLVPLETLDDPISEETAYRQVTGIGRWQLYRDYTTNIPDMQTVSREFRQPVEEYVSGYKYSDREALVAVHLGRNIESEKMELVMESGNQKLDDLISLGSERLSGFIQHPDTLKMFAAYPFDNTSTANQIIAVFSNAENTQTRITRNIEKPDTLLIAKESFDYVNYARIDNTLETSILDYYIDKSPYIKDVMPLLPLEGKGEDGSNCMCLYRRDPSRIRARIMQPMGFRKFIEQVWGIQRTATMRYGGIRLVRPFSVLWVSGL